jgi:hypothetical protein
MIWVVFLIFVGGAAVSIAITTYLHAWDSHSFWGMFIVTITYIALIAFMVWYANYLSKKNEDKYNMRIAWENVCKNVQSFPGENTLEWAKGINRNGERKIYYKGSVEKNYFAFFGILNLNRQYAIIIWCIEENAIVRYNTTNDPKMMGDPWHDFTPFENAAPETGMFNINDKRLRGRMNIPYGEPSGSYNTPMPDANVLEDFHRNQNKGSDKS